MNTQQITSRVRRVSTALAAGLAMVAASAGAAQAQTFLSGSGCAGQNFTFCSSYTFSQVSNSAFTLSLTNTSGTNPSADNAGSAFTQIAIGGTTLGNPATFADLGAGDWQYDADINGFNGFGLLANDFGGITISGINGALLAGQTAVFQFGYATDVFAGLTSAQIASELFGSAQIAIHDQGGTGENGCSTSAKGVVDVRTGTPTSASMLDARCGPPTNVVPEPSTYALMATGLLGLFGVARQRRASAQA
jgi:hypothetical protein